MNSDYRAVYIFRIGTCPSAPVPHSWRRECWCSLCLPTEGWPGWVDPLYQVVLYKEAGVPCVGICTGITPETQSAFWRRRHTQGLSKIFRAPIYRAHRAVIFAVAQRSCVPLPSVSTCCLAAAPRDLRDVQKCSYYAISHMSHAYSTFTYRSSRDPLASRPSVLLGN